MHWITFLFICIETAILFYLSIYRLARPDDKTAHLNIILIFLLIVYNITSGLLPDPNLPGSFFVQMSIAYSVGFMTPCYFPYYVYKAFGLTQMWFHAYRGVFYFLIIPCFLFVGIFAISGSLDAAKDILIIPTVYALWVIFTLDKAVRHKHRNDPKSRSAKTERVALLLSLSPWVTLPAINFFDLGQVADTTATNLGFLTLFAYQVQQHITALRKEHQRLITSEKRLQSWNTTLQSEVEKRTHELAKINEQQMNTFINLAHETKTPLTLVNNYMTEYLASHEEAEELTIVKANLDKLSADIVNLFDLEKFKKGFAVYNHEQTCNFSEQLKAAVPLFRSSAARKGLRLTANVAEGIFVKADPLSINRIVNNVIENAIKFSSADGLVHVSLKLKDGKACFSVKDNGPGIPVHLQHKIFEPYYQIGSKKKNSQGMGLGLPIVKKVVEDIGGTIAVISDPATSPGTEVRVTLPSHIPLEGEPVRPATLPLNSNSLANEVSVVEDLVNQGAERSLLLIEDNKAMLQYLARKLSLDYTVYTAINGGEALKKLNEQKLFPDLIVSDVMMDKVDGFLFASVLAKNPSYQHIPIIFLTAKSSPTDRLQGLRLGAIDFIQKPFLFEELLQKIRSVLKVTEHQRKARFSTGYFDNSEAPTKGRHEADERFISKCADFELTPREREITRLVCKGHRTKTIAETLFISEKTVSKHLENIFSKVGVTNKIELTHKLDCPD